MLKRRSLSLLLTGMLMLMASPLFALNSEMNRSTLQGLKGVRVLVEDFAPEIEREGLAKNQIQKDVEDKLRAGGMRVLTQEEALKIPGEPYLYVNLNVNFSKDGEEVCSYSIDIALIQNVNLVRNPKQTTYAVTWSTGGVGLIKKKSLGQLKESIEDVVDIFVRAFFSVNPKK
ncbi:MAG TPA: hypothetical protein VLK23_05310 [Thermodesulfobacteriota bacterium]|nr:hypothetical protein [Thermodesulfobacteriota bacterium]